MLMASRVGNHQDGMRFRFCSVWPNLYWSCYTFKLRLREFDKLDQLSQTYLYRRLNIPLVLFVSRYCLAHSGMFQFFTICISVRSDKSRSGFLFLAIVRINYLISTNDPANTGNIKFECLFLWTFTNNKVMFFFVFVFCLSTVNIFGG